jgi:hypothetical protein
MSAASRNAGTRPYITSKTLYHPVVERTQISLTEEQARRLRRLARRRRTSMAALIRDAVERAYPERDSADAAWDRALASLGGFHSGRTDISENHDAYLAEAYGE